MSLTSLVTWLTSLVMWCHWPVWSHDLGQSINFLSFSWNKTQDKKILIPIMSGPIPMHVHTVSVVHTTLLRGFENGNKFQAIVLTWEKYTGLRCCVMFLRYTSMQSSFFCALFPWLLLPRVSKALARPAASTPLSSFAEASQRKNLCRAWERVHDRAYN